MVWLISHYKSTFLQHLVTNSATLELTSGLMNKNSSQLRSELCILTTWITIVHCACTQEFLHAGLTLCKYSQQGIILLANSYAHVKRRTFKKCLYFRDSVTCHMHIIMHGKYFNRPGDCTKKLVNLQG